MRKINRIFVHCSDSDIKSHDNIETIRKWHTERGFTGPDGVSGNEDDIGYHYVITSDGIVHLGRDERDVGAGVKGHNRNSLHICLTGRKVFTEAQFSSLLELLDLLLTKHSLDWNTVKPHNEVDKTKTCPNFDLKGLIARRQHGSTNSNSY